MSEYIKNMHDNWIFIFIDFSIKKWSRFHGNGGYVTE